MITIEGPQDNKLAKMDVAGIAKTKTPLSIADLEHALLERFPCEEAESWDRMGLVVGDPAQLVEGVAVALDPTLDAVLAAERLGANVLLTHHPVFLEPPSVISPRHEIAGASGAAVFEAVRRGIALVNVHTALDVSDEAHALYASMLNVEFKRVIVPGAVPGRGYGMLCTVRAADKPFKLAHLAARCTSVFGRQPRVWGNFTQNVSTVVVANGSAGDAVQASLAAHADCLICGEVRYHAALDALQAGLCIVELGHDASELPLTAVLAQAARDAGVPADALHVLDQSANWAHPESTRI